MNDRKEGKKGKELRLGSGWEIEKVGKLRRIQILIFKRKKTSIVFFKLSKKMNAVAKGHSCMEK